jgi:hypothetical protein
MLMSQPQLNNLGVLPYAPEKWYRLAAGLTGDQLDGILAELEHDTYVVIDRDTDELLIRTFITHDKIWAQPKLVTNARKLIREVESPGIRQTLVDRHPWLVDDSDKAAIEASENLWKERGNETPSETPSETPIPTRARAGSGSGPGSRGSSGPSTSTAAASADAAAVELEQLLDQLHIPASLRTKARTDPDRALTVARYTIANSGSGAYFRTVWESGDTPATNSNGAQQRDPADRRRRFVEGDGKLLPPDELEYQLAEMGADEDELVGLLEIAADLRGAAA